MERVRGGSSGIAAAGDGKMKKKAAFEAGRPKINRLYRNSLNALLKNELSQKVR